MVPNTQIYEDIRNKVSIIYLFGYFLSSSKLFLIIILFTEILFTLNIDILFTVVIYYKFDTNMEYINMLYSNTSLIYNHAHISKT